ncbi:MAG: energy transducer TonB [Pseudomonadota bacterium]
MNTTVREERLSLWWPIAASLFLHFFFVGLIPTFGTWSKDTAVAASREKVLRVRFPETKSDRNLLSPKGELVDLLDSKANEKKAPDNAQFWSDKNRTAERETQARLTGPNPTSPIGRAGSTARESMKPGNGKFRWDVPSSILGKEMPAMGPSNSKLAMLAPSNYLPQIAIGDSTVLNTREYAYATFFIRMKRQMEAIWDPTSTISSERLARDQYVTTLQFTIKKNGYLNDLFLLNSSGNRKLDQEAIDAVRRAAPFLNPPPQLVEEDGLIHVPNWGFIVTLRPVY